MNTLQHAYLLRFWFTNYKGQDIRWGRTEVMAADMQAAHKAACERIIANGTVNDWQFTECTKIPAKHWDVFCQPMD